MLLSLSSDNLFATKYCNIIFNDQSMNHCDLIREHHYDTLESFKANRG